MWFINIFVNLLKEEGKKESQKMFKKKKKKKKRQKKKLTASCPVTNTRTEFSLAPGWTS